MVVRGSPSFPFLYAEHVLQVHEGSWLLLQVMLYRSLLQGLTDACDAELGSEILALHRLDGKAQLSKEVSSTVSLEFQKPFPLRSLPCRSRS